MGVSGNVPSPSVRFADLRVSDAEERKAILGAMETILDHRRPINGPEVAALEARLALYAERRFAVGVASGTEALVLALRAFGVGPGDEVVTTAVSWGATAIHLVGAEPVFADVRDDYNIDPDSVRRVISRRTKAVMPVHYAGRPYDGAAVDAIAREHGIYHIEDGSQAFGGISGERPVGRWGHVACCSANPMKLMTALGEAGFILCDDESVRDRFFRMRYNGVVPGDLHGPQAIVDREMISTLKRMAVSAPDRRSRFCLHQSHDDPVQEMLIVLSCDTRVPPHRQIGKRKSYYLLEGRLRLQFYDEGGQRTEVIRLAAAESGADSGGFACRFDALAGHTIFPETPFAVYVETIAGPFDPNRTDWAPKEWDWAG